MRVLNYFLHLFTPRPSNNLRARTLHTSAIAFYITALLIFQIGLSAFAGLRPGVLGYASSINVTDLLSDTNAKRSAAGVPLLTLNSQLSAAATAKGTDMFANQYWAHNSPQGKTPWDFINAVGYSYLFAGENLARDFNDSAAMVDAWMNSPSHRDNLLNNRFHDVGFAVVNGKYSGNETTLVVQMFGASTSAPATISAPEIPLPSPTPTLTPAPENVATSPAQASPTGAPALVPIPPETGMILQTQSAGPLVDILGLTKKVSSGLVLALAIVLAIDGLLVYRRKVVRLSGHNFAHLVFLLAVLVVINLISRGAII